MEHKGLSGAPLVAGMILLVIGCISIGYDLAKLVNDLEGAGPLAGVGAMCCALGGVIISRAANRSS